jgi:ketosteroid isomerase-like protein
MISRGLAVTVGALVLAGTGRAVPAAVDRRADEAAIRALIAQRDAGTPLPATSDRVLWLGSFQKPIVGDEAPALRTHERGIENRVPNSTKNGTTVRRIVVAESGDLAYEYSDGTLDFDLKDGSHVSSPNSTLRVWQKQDGQWKMAAGFSLTHYRD